MTRRRGPTRLGTLRVWRQTYPYQTHKDLAYHLDAAGQVIQTDVTREGGDVWRIRFDAQGRVTEDTQALTWTYSY